MEASHFSGCPYCPRVDDIYNAGKAHRAACHTHRTSWFLGSNLFSGWRDETEAEQRLRWKEIEEYEDVTSVHREAPEVVLARGQLDPLAEAGAAAG